MGAILFEIKLPGNPVAWTQPRFSGKFGGAPAKSDALSAFYGRNVPILELAMAGRPPIACAVEAEYVFVWERIDGLMPRARGPLTAIPTERIRKTTKPDRDNCEKALGDVLVHGGVLVDDSLLCDGPIRKWWGAVGERGHIHIILRAADGFSDLDVERLKAEARAVPPQPKA